MTIGRFIAALGVGLVSTQFGLCGAADATSAELTEAFSRLDALAMELAELRRALGEAGEPVSDSIPLPPSEAVRAPRPTDGAASEDQESGPAPPPVGDQAGTICGSRQEMAERISGLENSFNRRSDIIIGVHGLLPGFRVGVLDTEGICASSLHNEIESAMAGVSGLVLDPDLQTVAGLASCLDRSRETTNKGLVSTESTIGLLRLDRELALWTKMTMRVTELEQALLRGVSKRDRLMQELELFRHEIAQACQ